MAKYTKFFSTTITEKYNEEKKRVGMSANNNLLTLKGGSAQNIYVLYSVKEMSKITSTNTTAAMMPCGFLQRSRLKLRLVDKNMGPTESLLNVHCSQIVQKLQKFSGLHQGVTMDRKVLSSLQKVLNIG